ncbi:hypothetical protein H072_7276 [Dactylellina haptotyla CBS 200.50]|uniref:ER membrane protein complex subunit 7 beta-sandwich domain-containing protein n=1 Tax=Dactylellina haptotyla (strain CBS 200.50) TaxID=1284197 RepID=S8ACY0_DACHA|nr:hypothetical protein H072_7276 [Dactylellina haptotyla CBS 200.50]
MPPLQLLLLRLASLVLVLPFLTSAATVAGSIKPNVILPSLAILPPSTTVTLSGDLLEDSRTSHIFANGAFRFQDVNPGSYLLEVNCRTHIFPSMRVDVSPDGLVEIYQTFRGNEWTNKGERKPHPIDFYPTKASEFYIAREGFNPMKLLSNPMILIAIVAIGGMTLMPKMVENMDPETRAEFEKQQQSSMLANPQGNPLQSFDMAGYLAGSSSKKSGTPSGSKRK